MRARKCVVDRVFLVVKQFTLNPHYPLLSKELIEEYRELYRKHYGIEISIERAQLEGVELLNIGLMLCKHSSEMHS